MARDAIESGIPDKEPWASASSILKSDVSLASITECDQSLMNKGERRCIRITEEKAYLLTNVNLRIADMDTTMIDFNFQYADAFRYSRGHSLDSREQQHQQEKAWDGAGKGHSPECSHVMTQSHFV